MFDCWFGMFQLAAEAQQVVGLRLLRLGEGGTEAYDEAARMVTEKVDIGAATAMAMLCGATPARIVAAYRHEVQENARRLTAD